MDTKWIQQQVNLHDNPLEHNLGFFDFGKYHKAPETAKYAFDRVQDLLNFEMDSASDDSDEEDDLDGTTEDSGTTTGIPQTADTRRITRSSTSLVSTVAPKTTAQARKQMVTETKQSKDKLFFISRQRANHKKHMWFLVKVDEDETNWKRAKSEGVYHVMFYIRCLADSKKKKIRECAYWPNIHEFKRDGVTMGPIVPTKPSKVEHLLSSKPWRFMWYQDTLNIFESRLVGPFDFMDGYKVPTEAWDKLLKADNVYTAAINRIVPLDKPDFQDKDSHDKPSSHLAFRWKLEPGKD